MKNNRNMESGMGYRLVQEKAMGWRSAHIYSIDPYLVKQEDGQTYNPDGHVAIPWAARLTKTSLIPTSILPKALRSNPSVFKRDFSKNPGSKLFPLIGLFQRVQGNHRLKILLLLKNRKVT